MVADNESGCTTADSRGFAITTTGPCRNPDAFPALLPAQLRPSTRVARTTRCLPPKRLLYPHLCRGAIYCAAPEVAPE